MAINAFDLSSWFNADRLPSINHGAPCAFDFTGDLEEDGRFCIGGTAFEVRPADDSRILESVQVRIIAADASVAILGMNIIRPRP